MNALPKGFQAAARQHDSECDCCGPEDDVLERFADLSAERRAELLWDFIDRKRKIAGDFVQSSLRGIAVIEKDLSGDFADWLRDGERA